MTAWNRIWCRFSQDRPALEFLQIMLAGVSQIVWNTDPLCALVILAALALAAPIQLFACLWAVVLSTATILLCRLPKDLALDGLYTINPALSGIALPLVLFQNKCENLPLLFLLCGAAAILSLLLTVTLRRLTSPRQLAPLGLPYSFALLLLPLCVRLMTSGAAPASSASAPIPWTAGSFFTAVCNGLAQVIWIEGVPNSTAAGLLVLLGIALVSRIDAVIALYSVVLSTAAAVLMGLDPHIISLGLYGYGAVLLSLVLFGRAYKMNRCSFLLITILSLLSVPLTAMVRPFFGAIGAPVAAVVWSLLAIGAMCLRRIPGLTYVPPAYWTTPEQSRYIPATPHSR